MGWVSLTPLAQARKIAAAQTASTALPGTVAVSYTQLSITLPPWSLRHKTDGNMFVPLSAAFSVGEHSS